MDENGKYKIFLTEDVVAWGKDGNYIKLSEIHVSTLQRDTVELQWNYSERTAI